MSNKMNRLSHAAPPIGILRVIMTTASSGGAFFRLCPYVDLKTLQIAPHPGKAAEADT
jgi:hypothetical protein